MRAWRTAEGFLVEVGRTAAAVIAMQLEELPQGWQGLQEYVLLDEYGIVRQRFDVLVSSVEDDLGLAAHAVVDATFRSLTVNIHTGAKYRVSKTEETILSNLRPVLADEEETLELIREGLKCDAQLQLHRLEERARGAKAVAAQHALTPDSDDPELRRVMALVRARAESTGDLIDQLLLGVLHQCLGLHLAASTSEHASTGALAALEPAVKSVVLGCRRAVFDRSLGRDDPAPGPIIGSFSRLGEICDAIRRLAEMLADVEKRLLEAADGQERSDALLNAAAFRKAAVHFAQARERLLACLAR